MKSNLIRLLGAALLLISHVTPTGAVEFSEVKINGKRATVCRVQHSTLTP